jgi:phospholipid/cholesterol/gamma-HCH transport system permease protein
VSTELLRTLEIPALPAPPPPAEVPPKPGFRALFGDYFAAVGDWALFSFRATFGVVTGESRGRELLRVCYQVGVGSVGVVMITGAFIGMVLAVQTYPTMGRVGLGSASGAIISMSVVRELGPVLAAVMLAGRIGTAMAAQLGTMRVTEQIDALACLGVDPVRYLVGPRFLACIVMTPLLTVLADAMGVIGSSLICLNLYGAEPSHYWEKTMSFVKRFDLFIGLVKALVFGGVLSLICCHRGFHSRSGAEGVGRAATEGFVLSFVAIMVMDFLLAVFFNALHEVIWPNGAGRLVG